MNLFGSTDPAEALFSRFAPGQYILPLEQTVAPGCDADRLRFIFLPSAETQARIRRGFQAATRPVAPARRH